jgi:hypothetical protein
VELFATTLEAIAARDPDEPALDGLFIYCGDVPAEPPAGDSVVIAPRGDRVFGVEIGAEVRQPRVVTWDESDPRLRFAQLGEMHLRTARPIRGASARALVTTDAGPVIAQVTRLDGETTILGFDPTSTDWPTQPSFVIFFRNLLERARDRRAAGGVAPGRIGDALRVPAADGANVRVTTPGGERLSAISRGGVAIVAIAAEPGVYAIEAGEKRFHALRNLLDPAESDVRPRARFTQGGAQATARTADATEHQEAWPYLAGALLLLLVLEALWATRKGAT